MIIPVGDKVLNGTLDEMNSTGPAIWSYCNESGWKDEYCRTIDLNNDSIPDYQETWILRGEEPVAGPAEPPEWVEKLEKPVVSVGGMDL